MKHTQQDSLSRVALAFALLLIVSCKGGNDEKTTRADIPKSNLPGLGIDGGCEQTDRPSFCEWSFANDALVLGHIENIALVETPVFLAKYPPEPLQDDCDGPVDPVLEITLRIEEVFNGENTSKLSFRVGPRPLGFFSPRPRLADDGSTIKWAPSSGAIGEPLQIGQKIGVALLHFFEHDFWSVSSYPIFEFRENDVGEYVAVFQRRSNGCISAPTRGFEGLTASELLDKLSECSFEDRENAAALKETRISRSLDDPSWSFAASCYAFDDRVPGEDCLDDTDCLHPEVCIDELCQ